MITPQMRAVLDETLAMVERGEMMPPKVSWWWELRRAGEMTPEYLGRVLAAAGFADLAERARLGHFDDFHAPADHADGLELVRLVAELREEAKRMVNLVSGAPISPAKIEMRGKAAAAIENAVRRGEFDATRAESDRWAASKDGQETLAQLVRTRRPAGGRNALCPCGSGLKWKRCHGG